MLLSDTVNFYINFIYILYSFCTIIIEQASHTLLLDEIIKVWLGYTVDFANDNNFF